jgi:hypothetical protein
MHILRSSQTSSRAASFVSSGDCKSSSDRWPRLQKSSATSNYNKSSKRHPRCSRGQTRSSSLRRYTSKALYCRDIYFIPPGLERKIHNSRYAERTYKKNEIRVSDKTREASEVSLLLYLACALQHGPLSAQTSATCPINGYIHDPYLHARLTRTAWNVTLCPYSSNP